MKLDKREIIFDYGNFSNAPEFNIMNNEIIESIDSVKWPEGSDKFTIYPQSGKKRGEGNGVTPIKKSFMMTMETKFHWTLEDRLDIATVKQAGAIDATKFVNGKYFAVEWETGNISSSHRSINKMLLGMLKGVLIGGAIIVPSPKTAPFLTDRVGNYPELSTYFELWKAYEIDEGLMCIYLFEHDEESWDVPRIPKGTDGRSKE